MPQRGRPPKGYERSTIRAKPSVLHDLRALSVEWGCDGIGEVVERLLVLRDDAGAAVEELQGRLGQALTAERAALEAARRLKRENARLQQRWAIANPSTKRRFSALTNR